MMRALLVAGACMAAFASADDAVTTTSAVNGAPGPYPMIPNPYFCPASNTFCITPTQVSFFGKLIGLLKTSAEANQQCIAKLTEVVKIGTLILQQQEYKWWGASRRLGGGHAAAAPLCAKFILALLDAKDACVAAAILIDRIEDTNGICYYDLGSCPLAVSNSAQLAIKSSMNEMFHNCPGETDGFSCPFNARQIQCIVKAAQRLIAGLQALTAAELYAIKLLAQIGQLATTLCQNQVHEPGWHDERKLGGWNGYNAISCAVRNCQICQLVGQLEVAITKFCVITERLESIVVSAIQCFPMVD